MHIFIPKKLLFVAAGILILLIGIGIGGEVNQSRPSISPVSLPTEKVSPSPDVSLFASLPTKKISSSPSVAGTASTVSTELVKVTRVIDGDTIEIEGGERVRYIGIDTPETVDPRTPVQCFGVEASRKNKELAEGKEVRLEKDITDKDKYGRILRYVWAGESMINLELVKQGFASSYFYPPDIKHQDDFVKAEREARDAKRGLWGALCQENTNATAPIIAPSPTDTGANASGSCVIKGNINSSGEMIYHLPGCGSYDKTRIDESRGERWFCSESEALEAGWRRALNCL